MLLCQCYAMAKEEVEAEQIQIDPKSETNQDFVCPISLQPMRDPVIDTDGNTWDRSSILAWLKEHKTSPKSGNKLTSQSLVPNRILRNLIEDQLGPGFIQECQPVSTEAAETSRDVINRYLKVIGESVGKDIALNDSGISAFTYEHLTIVIEVPESPDSFFVYTNLSKDLSSDETAWSAALKKSMKLNYLQQETRGGCISMDPSNGEIIFSYRDRVSEINEALFRNSLENFIDAAIELGKALQEAIEAAATNPRTSEITTENAEAQGSSQGADDPPGQGRKRAATM